MGKRVRVAAAKRALRLAIALWNKERWELARDDGGSMPAFSAYADGRREGMPFHKQDAAFQRWWLAEARHLLRLLKRVKVRTHD